MCPQSDLVAQLVPAHERTSRSVFVAPEDDVFPKTETIDHSTTLFLRDADQLQAFLDEKSGRLNPKAPNARNGILTRLLLSATFKVGVADVNLGNAVFTPNLSRNLETYDQYVVYENGVTSAQFAELFQLFMATPAHRRPCVLLISNRDGSRLIEKLSYSRETIDFINVSKPFDRVINVQRLAPTQTDDYLDLYCRGVYHAAARSKLPSLLAEDSEDAVPFRTLMANVLQFQTRLMTEERHYVERDIDAVLADPEMETDKFEGEHRDDCLRLKCYLLLQKTYCSEKKEPLEQALAISSVLGNEFDNALCLRYAHFLGQEAELERHMLARAERVFRENDCLELALYAANNLKLVDFASNSEQSDSFTELCKEIEERIPGLHRKFDIEYNRGVQVLFSRELDRAEMIFVPFTSQALVLS